MEKWQENDCRRQQVIKEAVDTANRIIGRGSDGSVEETNYLTAEVAFELIQMALVPFHNDLRRHDNTDKGEEEEKDD